MLLEATFATGGQVWASRIEAIRGCNATANSKYRMRLGRSVELSSTFRRLPNTPGGVLGKQAEHTIQPNTPPGHTMHVRLAMVLAFVSERLLACLPA